MNKIIYTVTSDALESHRSIGYSIAPITDDAMKAQELAQKFINMGLRGVQVLANDKVVPLDRIPNTWGVSA